jgi:hypothetical protein
MCYIFVRVILPWGKPSTSEFFNRDLATHAGSVTVIEFLYKKDPASRFVINEIFGCLP